MSNVIHLITEPVYKLFPVPKAYLDDVIEVAMPLLDRARQKVSPETDYSQIEKDLRSGDNMLWIVCEKESDGNNIVAALSTTIVENKVRKTFRIDYMGGSKMDQWMWKVLQKFEFLAKEAECSAIVADARTGWNKFCKVTEFVPKYTRYEMELK